jgi:hypothetical protein
LKWWPQIGWESLDIKRVNAFLGLKYWNFNQSSTQSQDGRIMGLKKSLIFKNI